MGFLGCRLIVRGGPECHGESRVARDTWWVPPSSLPGRFRVSNGLPRARDGTCRVAGSCLQRRETQHPGSGLVLPARFILAHGLGEPPRTVGAWLALGALGLWRQLRPAPVATRTSLKLGGCSWTPADSAPLTDSNGETRWRPTFCFLLLHSLQLVEIRSRVGRGGTRSGTRCCMTSDIISVGDRVR